MQQLSGGQKSLVALALIFAIQRSDPAPFYLFDEIDSALDTTYRAAVAKMMRKQVKKNKIQFIASTFRPELVQVATKWYAITFRNRESRIAPVSKEEALMIIKEQSTLETQKKETRIGGESNPDQQQQQHQEEEEDSADLDEEHQ